MKTPFSEEELKMIQDEFGGYTVNKKGNVEIRPAQDTRPKTIKYCIYKDSMKRITIRRQIMTACKLHYCSLFRDTKCGVWKSFSTLEEAFEKFKKYLININGK